MPKKSAVILLSGGLDSYVSLVYSQKQGYDIKLALTFDYGQKAALEEISASEKICAKYGVELKVIKLPFLAEISNSALNKDDKKLEFETLGKESARAVWVPNRNGLFLNIAASFCDAFGYKAVIIGANKEEAATFLDNSIEFCNAAETAFKYSTNAHPTVVAPLSDLEKCEIISLGVELGIDFKLLKSCYASSKNSDKARRDTPFHHCGVCESCKRLKSAILKSGNKDLLKLFF